MDEIKGKDKEARWRMKKRRGEERMGTNETITKESNESKSKWTLKNEWMMQNDLYKIIMSDDGKTNHTNDWTANELYKWTNNERKEMNKWTDKFEVKNEWCKWT